MSIGARPLPLRSLADPVGVAYYAAGGCVYIYPPHTPSGFLHTVPDFLVFFLLFIDRAMEERFLESLASEYGCV